MAVDPSKVRTVAVVGHAGCGKTSLIDALLFAAKAVPNRGRVAQGTSVADCQPEEIERKITIHAKSLFVPWQGHSIYLLDTPGFADLIGEVVASVRAADAAIVVVDGVSGVDVGTRRVWKLLEQSKKPRLLWVSKLDKENSDFARTVEQLRAVFGKHCVPFQWPVGAQSDFSRVIHLPTAPDSEIPAELQGACATARESLTESAAEHDDALLEKYLGGEKLTPEEVARGARAGVTQCALVPLLCGCADRDIGISQLLEAVVGLLPSPADVGAVAVAEGDAVEPRSDAPFSGFVFKVTVDPYAGQLAYVRVHSGTLRSEMEVLNTGRRGKERVPQLLRLQGKTQSILAEAGPGDIVALVKLKETHVNDTLADPARPVRFPPMMFPKPVMSYAVHPHTAKDEEKISVAIHRLREEDPTFYAERNPHTKELVISGMGDQHLAVVVDNMKKKLGVNVDLSTPKVDYKETVTARSDGHYKHKKQSGGRGQYGEAYLKLAPLERGAGFQFVDEIVGGSIPRNFIPAVEKGCVEALQGGVVAGFQVVDVQATVYDGSYHDVDSNELSFKISGLHAFKEAMQKARPVLLEPILNVTVTIPDQYMGDITGDLNHRRGHILAVESSEGMQTIKAQAPQSEMFKYASELRSMTGGRGSFEMEYSHYAQVPTHVAQKVIAEAQAAKKAES